MQTYVVDTNFFISGFQSKPSTFSIFAKILKKAEIQIVIPTYIKNELRYFVQREILPHVVVEEVDERKFQDFLRKIHEQTASLPQKPDLSVIYIANKLAAPIISSDLKLLETAELLGIKTYTDSAFVRFLLEINQEKTKDSFLKELETKLFTAEIRYSVSSTNRYDPVKRIKKILDSAISVIRTEYEEKMKDKVISDIADTDGFSIESMQLKELIAQVRSDLLKLEDDFVRGLYRELEEELLYRVREITDSLIDWKLASENIEDHKIYNDSLLLLGRLQYLACICLIENKKLDLARVYMDKLMMILFQTSDAYEEYGVDVHFLRMILLLLSGQLHRLNSYFSIAFEEVCTKHQRADVINVIRSLILLTVILGGEKVEKTASDYDYENIEFINQLGFKFMQLEDLHKASLMFEQTFYLSLNTENKGFCIASLEYLSWLYFSGLNEIKAKISELYTKLVKKYPDIKSSYHPKLQLKTSSKDLQDYIVPNYFQFQDLPKQHKSSLYCLGVDTIQTRNKTQTLIRVMNWEIMARIGIIDENSDFSDKTSLGTIIHIIDGKYKILRASSNFRKNHNIELLMYINKDSTPTIAFRNPGGWDITQIEKTENKS
ncbi:MAG: hypothetical protein ACTSUR_00265 [Candidatus Heimdallarchaeaceae archaeon]